MKFQSQDVVREPVRSFTPSTFQQALLDFADDLGANFGTPRCPKSAIIEAVAGSGKSTTLEQMLRRLPSRLRVCAISFNKKIAEALKARMPTFVDCSTVNSLGHRSLCAWLRGIGQVVRDVDGNKVRGIIREYLDATDGKAIGSQVARLVELAKAYGLVPTTALSQQAMRFVSPAGCLVPDTMESWQDIMGRHDMDVANELEEMRIISSARQVLARSFEMALMARIDFSDQVYMTVAVGAPVPQYDVVAGDEVQDWNLTDRALVRAMMARNGDGTFKSRLIAVGDRMQSIYGFRGADTRSMEAIQREFDCDVYPLSITYRCPASHVRLAQEIVPSILPAPWAQEGIHANLPTFSPRDFSPSDMIVCRKTASLVSLAYQLIAARVPCRVLGRKIGDGLITLIEKMRVKTLDELDTKLDAWAKREVARFEARGEADKAQSAMDKVSTIDIIMGSMGPGSNVSDLCAEIRDLFSSDDPDPRLLTLCTVHRAKGLEADVVYVLDRHEMPSRWARRPDDKQQERNIEYVALTRAKEAMFFITSGTMQNNDNSER